MTVRQDLETALEGGTPERTPLSIYDWNMGAISATDLAASHRLVQKMNRGKRMIKTVFVGVDHRGGDINDRNQGWAVIHGVANFDARSTEYSTAGTMNPWLEMDFGHEIPLDQVIVKSTLKPIYDDRAVRLVTVLDGIRRVVWTATTGRCSHSSKMMPLIKFGKTPLF